MNFEFFSNFWYFIPFNATVKLLYLLTVSVVSSIWLTSRSPLAHRPVPVSEGVRLLSTLRWWINQKPNQLYDQPNCHNKFGSSFVDLKKSKLNSQKHQFNFEIAFSTNCIFLIKSRSIEQRVNWTNRATQEMVRNGLN